MNNIIKDGSILYLKETCCGCEGCKYICPQSAITMRSDNEGNTYPDIDLKKCISCHLCINKCAYSKENKGTYPLAGYAVINNNSNLIKKSASGGAFSAIAERCLNMDFTICGSKLKFEENVYAEHIAINDINRLSELCGSKYTQSSLNNVYPLIEDALRHNKHVLFSGVPCQVAEVKEMFSQYNELLYTIDIICHGVPSKAIFIDYIKNCEAKQNGRIVDFTFRDKEYGWGKLGSAILTNKNKTKKINFTEEDSSYYSFFMDGCIQRRNCFTCPYAKEERYSDLTLGDYWGVEIFQPEILKSNGGPLDEKKGVSAVLVNSRKGKELMEDIDANIVRADVRNIIQGNSQLRHPVPKNDLYELIIKKYRDYGYKNIEKYFGMIRMKKRIKNAIKKILHCE